MSISSFSTQVFGDGVEVLDKQTANASHSCHATAMRC